MTQYLRRRIRRFHANDEAATAVEYAIMLGLIIVGCIAAILGTGEVQQELWFDLADTLETVLPG